MQQFVYHRKPRNMQGTTLWPLNDLRNSFPDIYQQQRRKYQGREALMEERIAILDCLWNDVVHCAPLNPRLSYEALRDAGAAVSPDCLFYVIPLERLSGLPAVWYRSAAEHTADQRRQYEVFDHGRYRELVAVPTTTKAYYGESMNAGRAPLLYVYVPHVLVKGPIYVSAVDVICWSSP